METFNCDEAAKKSDGRHEWFIDRIHLSKRTKIRSLKEKSWCLGMLDYPEYDEINGNMLVASATSSAEDKTLGDPM